MQCSVGPETAIKVDQENINGCIAVVNSDDQGSIESFWRENFLLNYFAYPVFCGHLLVALETTVLFSFLVMFFF